MFFGVTVNFSILLAIFALGFVSLWAMNNFLGKNGLSLFTILSLVLMFFLPVTTIFGLPITMSAVFLPLVYFVLYIYNKKYGKEDAKKLFIVSVVAMTVIFVCIFFTGAFIEAEGFGGFMTWATFGKFVASLLGFTVTVFATNIIIDTVEFNGWTNYLKNATTLAIACAIDNVIFTIFAYTGLVAFGTMMLIMLCRIVISTGLSFLLAYLLRLFVKEPKAKKENKKVEEVKQETKVENQAEDLYNNMD